MKTVAHYRTFILLAITPASLIPLLAGGAQAGTSGAIDIGARRQLLVDGFLVDQLKGKAELRLHHPVPREIVLVHDAPWEGNATAYDSVFQDGGLYRMYYRAWTLTVTPDGIDADAHPQAVCYAESDDGIHWRRPVLGLYEFQGSKANNIVFVGDKIGAIKLSPGSEAVFKDDNPKAARQARYKTFRTCAGAGLLPFQSPDGIHWLPMSDTLAIIDHAWDEFDSQQCAFWEGDRGEYRVYWRHYDPAKGGRAIRTASSKDFLHWENRADLTYVDSPAEELYESCVKPYYRAPQVLIGFPTRYVERGWSDSVRALPDRKNREWRAGRTPVTENMRQADARNGTHHAMENGRGAVTVHERYGTALTEGLIMAGRDGVNFKRWNEAFLRPGIERPGSWNYGSHYLGWQLVETKSALAGAPNELSLYAIESYATGKSSRLRRYSLRLDGFVSAQAPLSGGELVTQPLRFQGRKLSVNFSTSAAGGLRVELQDGDGKALPGFSLDDCPSLFGDTIERRVTWDKRKEVGSLAGRPVRLRFELKDGDLYSFQFTD